MKEGINSLEEQTKSMAKKFLETTENKEILIISHFDTDGITSASIMIKTLKKLDKRFSIKIKKSLEEQFIYDLPKDKIILFLDLASNSLSHITNAKLNNVFIIDHHEVTQVVPENISIINPELNGKEKISGAGLTYLFCKEILPENKECAKLAVLGMIGDCLEKNIDKLNNGILNDSEIKKRRGVLIYPSTRPLNRALEFCSNPYVPGVTGNIKGVLEMLREINLNPTSKGYPSLIELNEEEMQKLVTAIMLRKPKARNQQIIGDIFLLKFFNKLEDAREMSAMINACSKLEKPEIAIQLCMEIPKAKKKAEAVHAKYKQHLISGLRFAEKMEKIQGKNFIIINAKENIRDTMIGTIISILSNSSVYEEGTIIFGMAYCEDKIKISSRCCGEGTRNLREILSDIIEKTEGETGGHEFAAGAIISKEKENEFIDLLKKTLELEVVKI
jgi:single-stranded-DNA-specific exonuclease